MKLLSPGGYRTYSSDATGSLLLCANVTPRRTFSSELKFRRTWQTRSGSIERMVTHFGRMRSRQEMDTVKVAFRVLEPDEEIPPGYQEIKCHLVFTVKMENFRRKARYVAGGHVTEAPATLTYASVVSRETVRVALTIAALNALEVKTADVEGAYLTAPNLEKIWVLLGPEFGPDAGKKAIVVRALYGLKSAGASFRSVMADCMQQLGFKPCKADPDLWMKPAVRPDDGTYVLDVRSLLR